MLLNWFASSTSEDNHLRNILNSQDLKTLGVQYCTHLLAAGVLRQIPDKDAPTEKIFKVTCAILLVFKYLIIALTLTTNVVFNCDLKCL